MKRLLIVRPDGIGDFVIFSAVLEEYTKLYPDSKIDLLCLPRTKGLVESIPFINRVVYVDSLKFFGKKHIPYTLFSIIRLLFLKYDKVIYPVFSRTKGGDTIVKFIRAKEKIAFDGNSSNDLDNSRFKRNAYYTKIITSDKCEKTEIERNVDFLNRLGSTIDVKTVKTRIWYSENDEGVFKNLRDDNNLYENNYITIFPGAGSQIKYWPRVKWISLIGKFLKKNHDIKIVLLGFGNDSVIIRKIIDGLHECEKRHIVNLCNKTTLRVMAKVIERSRLLVGSDSCVVHISAAVGTPNVCIMGGGHFGRFYPYGDLNKNRIVFKDMDCFNCNWQCPYPTIKCLDEIVVDDVWDEVLDLDSSKMDR